jgi:hypothetical protein
VYYDNKPRFDWTVDTPLNEVIGQAVGAASMCWEHPERAGVFKVEQATAIVDEVMNNLYLKSYRGTGSFSGKTESDIKQGR